MQQGVSSGLKNLWHRETRGKHRRKEGLVQPLHHTCQMCHHHTQEHTYLWRDPQ